MTEHRLYTLERAIAICARRMRFAPAPIILVLAAWLAASAQATDLPGVLHAALDQPRINAVLRRTPTGPPLSADLGGEEVYNVEAFFDTGASGLLLSDQTAEFLGVARTRFPDPVSGQLVEFVDVGVAGSEIFNVSEPLYVGLSPFLQSFDSPPLSSYTQNFGPLRMQISAPPDDPQFEGLDIFGVPTMAGKVVVMDPRPTDDPLGPNGGPIHTFVYNPGTPFNPTTQDTNPGIPPVDRHIAMSYGQFDRFTEISPAGAPGPTLQHNPFIGPNPVLQLDPNPPADDTPPVTITFGNQTSSGSWLFDTGAAASMISEEQAANLGVRYRAGADPPVLEDLNGTLIPDQFTLPIGGIGGITNPAGFYLDRLLLRTQEGNAADDDDPNHIRYLGAPVLVADITLQDPITEQTLTLDGIFGMNMLVGTIDLPTFFTAEGYFNWITFDEPNGLLGLDLKASLPEPQNEWFRPTSGNWGDANNWSNLVVPDANNASVRLGPVVTANANIDLQSTNRTLRSLRFSHTSRSYTVTSTGGGTLLFNSAAGPASIQFDVANFVSHEISAPIRMQSDVEFQGLFDDLQLTLSGGQTWDAGRSLMVRSGNLRYNLDNADAVTVGGDNTLVIDDGATVTLAGTETPLAAGGNFVDVINNSENGFIVESGHHDVGFLTGEGSTIVESGSTLSTGLIDQSSLSIGVGSVVTIRPGSGTLRLGDLSFLSTPAPAPDARSAASSVPEPGALALAAVGLLTFGLLFRQRRRA